MKYLENTTNKVHSYYYQPDNEHSYHCAEA